MPETDLEKTNKRLVEILSQEQGLFGRVYTWGQRPTKYEFVGYELDKDFLPTLQAMSDDQKGNLRRIMNYFEIHARPLKKMLEAYPEEGLYKLYSEWSWSHFMTVVMFGMLEVAVKISPCVVWSNQSKGHMKKGESIKLFLETYLPQDVRSDIAERYKTESGATLASFAEVVDHLWSEIRSGFIHEGGVHSKGLEWSALKGLGTKDEPITIETDVPMQELMQITWQAILNFHGYKGSLKLSRYKK